MKTRIFVYILMIALLSVAAINQAPIGALKSKSSDYIAANL